ncbi:uncharacterized protein [Rutidosis leptorrhynchoides]|uniref:uncharacterized protein n=1 Tax=Rutidosis leptorrhynchoides TaxID=125765 RepID=UPI003A9A44CF
MACQTRTNPGTRRTKQKGYRFRLCALSSDIETTEHILLHCPFAKDVWSHVFHWCKFGNVSFSSLEEMFEGQKPSSQSPSKSFLWQPIEWTCGYTIWRNRNLAIFQKKKGNGPMTLDEIQVKSFEWISKRSKACSLDWNQWLLNPSIQDDHG